MFLELSTVLFFKRTNELHPEKKDISNLTTTPGGPQKDIESCTTPFGRRVFNLAKNHITRGQTIPREDLRRLNTRFGINGNRSSSTSPIFYGAPNYTEIQAQAPTATSTPDMSFIDETGYSEINEWPTAMSGQSPLQPQSPPLTRIQAQTNQREDLFEPAPSLNIHRDSFYKVTGQSPLQPQSPPLTRIQAQTNQREDLFDPAASLNIHRDSFYKVTGWPKPPSSPETSSISIRSARSPTPKATQTVVQAQPRPTWHEYMSLWLAYERLTRNAHTWACTESEYCGNIYQSTYVLKDNLKEEKDLELLVLSCFLKAIKSYCSLPNKCLHIKKIKTDEMNT